MTDSGNRAAGRTTQSMQYKEPATRVSNTYADSNIFGARSSNPIAPSESSVRISKTYQDSNIFGTKDSNSATLTDNVRREMKRSAAGYRDTAAQHSNMHTIFTNDDKVARGKLRRSSDVDYQPVYHKSSPTKRHISEFYGEHHSEYYDGALLRPEKENALSKSVTLSPRSAKQTKRNELNSNIFLDNDKSNQMNEASGQTNMDRLLSASSKWNSHDTFKKSANLRKSEDLSSNQLRVFAQNKKKQEMNSDIFNSNPNKTEPAGLDYERKGPPSARATFGDTKNEDIKRTQHMFSDILGHDDKNYDYSVNTNNGNDPSIPTNLAWNDSRTEKFSPKKQDPSSSANDRKKAFLGASEGSLLNVKGEAPPKSEVVSGKSLERAMLHNMSPQEKKGFEMRSEVPFGEDSQKWSLTPQPANESSIALDFDLKSIPKGMDMETLKKVFGGYHVIDLKTERNNVTGNNLGSGRVKIRTNTTHDVLKLKHDLKEHGILMLSHYEKHNKKNTNYRDLAKVNWHDQYLQAEEGRIKSDFNTAQESKLKNLESEGDIFGNTKGVGKWDRDELERAKEVKSETKGEQRSTKDLVNHLNWKKTIKGVQNTRKSEAPVTESKPKASVTKSRPSTAQSKKSTK